jgi:hypothetical protein
MTNLERWIEEVKGREEVKKTKGRAYALMLGISDADLPRAIRIIERMREMLSHLAELEPRAIGKDVEDFFKEIEEELK